MRRTGLSYRFVEFIPERLEEGVLYISQRYSTAAHKCCCGCGEEVITPLTPTDWSVQTDGNVVSLYPSIGNWSFACRSHYWIYRGNVIWAGDMTQQEIERGRAINRAAKQAYFQSVNQEKLTGSHKPSAYDSSPSKGTGLLYSLWLAIKRLWNS